jgi:hypothetical protein
MCHTCGKDVAQNVKTSCFKIPSPLWSAVRAKPLGRGGGLMGKGESEKGAVR